MIGKDALRVMDAASAEITLVQILSKDFKGARLLRISADANWIFVETVPESATREFSDAPSQLAVDLRVF